MNSMWWPPNRSIGGFLNQSIFLILSSLSAFNYFMATLTGPGYLPKNWKPKVNKFNIKIFINKKFILLKQTYMVYDLYLKKYCLDNKVKTQSFQ